MIYLIAIYFLVGLFLALIIDEYESVIYLEDVGTFVFMILFSPTILVFLVLSKIYYKIVGD